MAAFQKFNQFVEDLGRGVHNLNTGVIKVVLTNSAPVATNAVLADITQIASGNGYTTGGATVAATSFSQVAGVAKLAGNDVIWTSVTGNMGPFRYAVAYNDTPTSPADPLIGWWDRGASLTLDGTQGDTFTLDLNNTDIIDVT